MIVSAGGAGFYFKKIKPGWTTTKFLVLADTSDGEGYQTVFKNAVKNCHREGYAVVKRCHTSIWKKYSGQSSISLPDERFQHIYDLSLYQCRASQHKRSGAITVGLLPHLWGGGICVPYDAYFMHQALLLTNHSAEGQRHLDFYRRQRPAVRKLCRRLGLKGAGYSGWSNCFGEHIGGKFSDYILHVKPVMSAFIVLKFYWQWVYDSNTSFSKDDLDLMREILDLAIDRLIDDRGTEAVIKPCMAGNESGIVVKNDTFTCMVYARALRGFAEMAEAMGYRDAAYYETLSKKMYTGLEKNYADGVLHLFPGARYLGTFQQDFFLFNLPEGINRRSIDESIKAAKTPWGLNTDQPEEGYRDWPWLSTRTAITLAHLGDNKESFKYLKNSIRFVSALGAIPEKIRMDGFPIGFWYPTPHALEVWAIVAALCLDGRGDELCLLQGLDGEWRNLSFKKLRMKDGLQISGDVKEGKLVCLKLTNGLSTPIERSLRINPAYSGIADQRIIIAARKSILLKG